jgi:hypothetical protein
MTCLQAPIPLAELGPADGRRSGGLVPGLRDALFTTFMDSSSRARPASLFRTTSSAAPLFRPTSSAAAQAAESSSTTSTKLAVLMVFKVLGGRLLCQLHTRAARSAAVPDVWFHAPSLQHEQFRKGARSPACKRALQVAHHFDLTLVCARAPHRTACVASLTVNAWWGWTHVCERVEVSKAIGMDEIFSREYDSGGDVLAAADDAESAPAGGSTGLAYIELLRYAPCIVPFTDRAIVFQELIERDKDVRGRRCAAAPPDLTGRYRCSQFAYAVRVSGMPKY